MACQAYTLTYDEGVKGWPSFYSFYPEYIKGMNAYLYTFSGGNLYRHNVNSLRKGETEVFQFETRQERTSFSDAKELIGFRLSAKVE